MLAFLTAGRLVAGGGRWSHFALLGADHTNLAAVPFPVALAPKGGYDGQFFLRLATDPWPTEPEANGLSLDHGAYRHQRILYPTLAWGLSLGNPARAPAALVAINFVAVLGLVYIWSLLALAAGVEAGWGLAVLAIPGVLLAYGRDTAEPVTLLFISLGFLMLIRRRFMLLTMAMALAVLAREDALIMVFALGVGSLWFGKEERIPAYTFLTPIAVFILWQIVLFTIWGEPGVATGQSRLSAPLLGIVGAMRVAADQSLAESGVQALYVIWHVLLGLAVWRTAFGPDRPTMSPLQRWVFVGWVGWLLLAVSLSWTVWEDEWAFSRVLSAWSACGVMLLLTEGRRPGWALSALSVVLLVGSVARLVLRP